MSIYDFREHPHSEYPEIVGPDSFPENKLITRETRVVSMGSCFARNIALKLMAEDYNYLITEKPFKEGSAHWDSVMNTSCMSQIFNYTFNPKSLKAKVRWWERPDRHGDVQDPFRRNTFYSKDTCDIEFSNHIAASRKALETCDVLILTLGLTEVWYDKRDGLGLYQIPPKHIYNPDIHKFKVKNPIEVYSDLINIGGIMMTYNPDAQIILTVSPIPLMYTFEGRNAVTSDSLSKATLRVAADMAVRNFGNFHYFPSYEIVTRTIPQPIEQDNRHVTEAGITIVFETFKNIFCS